MHESPEGSQRACRCRVFRIFCRGRRRRTSFSPTFSIDSAQVVVADYKQDMDDLGLEFLGDWTPEELKAKLGAFHNECSAAVRVCWYLAKY